MLCIPEYKNAEKVFFFFEEISKIPHASGNTEKIAEYLVNFAKERGLWYKTDEYNNVIIRKGATKGYENRPTIVFQGHTDMVADKIKGCQIDMDKDEEWKNYLDDEEEEEKDDEEMISLNKLAEEEGSEMFKDEDEEEEEEIISEPSIDDDFEIPEIDESDFEDTDLDEEEEDDYDEEDEK